MKPVLLVLALQLASVSMSVAAVDVTHFGAVPNDGKDDTEAFLAAFRAAQATGDKLIEIPKGRYNLRADGNPEHRYTLFSLTNVDGLSVRGKGAELMMHGNGAVFAFKECKNITVKGLTLDWERPPFSQGTVSAATTRYFDVQIEAGFPVQGGE